jgi:hypothetical protein
VTGKGWTPNGSISSIAGNGTAGFLDNTDDSDKDATTAQLNRPIGLSLDSAGNLYIADSYNFRIRKLGTNSKLTTVAGMGTAGRAGDGGAATSAQLNYPESVGLSIASCS